MFDSSVLYKVIPTSNHLRLFNVSHAWLATNGRIPVRTGLEFTTNTFRTCRPRPRASSCFFCNEWRACMRCFCDPVTLFDHVQSMVMLLSLSFDRTISRSNMIGSVANQAVY